MDEVKDVMANVYFASQLCMLSLIEEREKILYECFKKAKNGVFVVLDCSKELDPLFLDKINHLLNVEMLKVAHIKPIEGYHCSVTSAVIYKHIYGDLGASVEQKLMESEAENLITSWEVVNEKYPN